MPSRPAFPFVCFLLVAITPARAWAQPAASQPPAALASRLSSAIRVDGVLDEEAWRRARPIGGLTQREPKEGGAPSEETEVRVLFDADALYFGVTCRDRTPSAIVSSVLTRDADLDVDDAVTVVLDPFVDHRNGFFFRVNPAGARADGQIANNAEHATLNWDGIWDASARRTSEGWVVEMVIPFKTLRFKPGQATWGLNVERHIKRLNETDRWAAARRDVWFSNLSEAGRLEGLEGIRQGRGLDIRPYALGGREHRDGRAQAGVDIFKNVTPNLNGSLTVNTDFAETEVDARQINLTRFPLFFPEKRAFFLEGAGVFETAGSGEDLMPFFSRRIGLVDAQPVPITAGGKLVGRQGSYNVGVLDVQTRNTEDLPGLDVGHNLFAARVSRNILRQSSVGVIVTNGNPVGGGRNTLVGADALFSTSSFRGDKNLSVAFYALGTDDEATGRRDAAFGTFIDYPNDLLDTSFSFKQIGDGFVPALGFVPRTGIRKYRHGLSYQPRPGGGLIRQLFFEFRPEVITDLSNRVENWRVFTAPFNAETESGEHLEFNYVPEFERLPEPFEISDGVTIPPGSYRWTRWAAEAETASKRPWVLELHVGWGGFYSGTRRDVEAGVTLKPSTHVLLAFAVERNDVALPQGKFHTQVVTAKADYNFSPDVSWANLVQYDNESRLLGFQSRFRWILKPGSDLFVVLNRGWAKDPEGGYHRAFDKGSAKLQYTFRL
jgi:hypothetical protein